MTMTIVKAFVSGLVILGINVLAKKSLAFGGWVAALPLISLLSAFWLAADQRNNMQIAEFLQGVVWGLIPTAIMLVVIVVGLRYGLNLLPAIACGVGVWAVYTWTVQYVV